MLSPDFLKQAIPVFANAFMKRFLVGLPAGTQINQQHLADLAECVYKAALAVVQKRPPPRSPQIANKACACIFAEEFVAWPSPTFNRGTADFFERKVGIKTLQMIEPHSDEVILQTYAAIGAAIFVALCGAKVAEVRSYEDVWVPLVLHFKSLFPHASKEGRFEFLAVVVSSIEANK